MTDNNSTTRNRMVLLLIGGIPLTVALVATWLWYFVVRGDLDLVNILGTANRGELVQPPRQLDDQVLLDGVGTGNNAVRDGAALDHVGSVGWRAL